MEVEVLRTVTVLSSFTKNEDTVTAGLVTITVVRPTFVTVDCEVGVTVVLPVKSMTVVSAADQVRRVKSGNDQELT